MTLPNTAGRLMVSLMLAPAPALAPMLQGDLAGASATLGVALLPFFMDEEWLCYRLDQIERVPAYLPVATPG